MTEGIVSVILGIVCIVIGILNQKGNISMLHSYHRNNIKEEDKLPFGKRVGIGMYIVGVSLIINGVLTIIDEITKNTNLKTIGEAILIVGLIVGIAICLLSIQKYNKKTK